MLFSLGVNPLYYLLLKLINVALVPTCHSKLYSKSAKIRLITMSPKWTLGHVQWAKVDGS